MKIFKEILNWLFAIAVGFGIAWFIIWIIKKIFETFIMFYFLLFIMSLMFLAI